MNDYIDEEKQQILLDLYFEIYRTTNNYTNVNNYMKSLVNKYNNLEEIFFESLIKLRDTESYQLQPLLSYLLEFDNVNDDLFNLYEKLFVQDKTNAEQVKEKLTSLVTEYLSEKDTTIEKFLVIMLNHDKTKEILTSIVVELSTENIVELPKDIQHLTYDYLCENDMLFDIESKIDFIKEILAFDNKYKDCIVKIIVSKLQEKAKVKGALEILEGFSHPSKEQKSKLYNALIDYKNHSEYGKEISKLLKKYEDKGNS